MKLTGRELRNSYNEAIWLYCDKCGSKFSSRRNNQQKFCPQCHDEYIRSRTEYKTRNNIYNYTWRLVFDPEGLFSVGARFGTFDIYYGLRYGSFCNGTVLVHIKDKCQFTVKDRTLVNSRKIVTVGRNGRLVYVPRKGAE